MNWKLIREAIKTSLIQHFEADFLWKVSLKILNSGLILINLENFQPCRGNFCCMQFYFANSLNPDQAWCFAKPESGSKLIDSVMVFLKDIFFEKSI